MCSCSEPSLSTGGILSGGFGAWICHSFAASPWLAGKFCFMCLKIKSDHFLIFLSTYTDHGYSGYSCSVLATFHWCAYWNLSLPFWELFFNSFPLVEKKIQRSNFVSLQGRQIPTVEYLLYPLPHAPCLRTGHFRACSKSCFSPLCLKENAVLRLSYMAVVAAWCLHKAQQEGFIRKTSSSYSQSLTLA